MAADALRSICSVFDSSSGLQSGYGPWPGRVRFKSYATTLCHTTGPVGLYHTHVFQTRRAVELRRPHTPEAELQLCFGSTLVPGSSHFLFDSILTVLHAAILQARRCSLTGRKLSILSHVLCGHLFYDLLVVLLQFQFLVCVKFHFLTPSVRKN